jgi:pseudaminic acid cytidylyltransferase
MIKTIAIIPARGGSKRIKNKNIKLFNNKPMIFWSINTALKSKLFDQIIVSTDNYKIAKIAKDCGAIVPFLRDKKLSDDITSPHDVVKDTLNKLSADKINPKYVCCIYACAPFITIKDLKSSFNKLKKTKDGFILPITEYAHPIQRAFSLNFTKKIIVNDKQSIKKRTQDLKKYYHDTGQFSWGRKETWVNKDNVILHSVGHIIPSWRSVDIDNSDDWKRAELMWKLIISK